MGTLVRYAAIAASVLVALGFAMFLSDRAGEATQNTIQKIEVDNPELPDPSVEGERQREARNGPVREYIDDANDLLLKPFAGLLTSGGITLRRVVSAALALLLYGLGGTILAGYLDGLRLRRRAATA